MKKNAELFFFWKRLQIKSHLETEGALTDTLNVFNETQNKLIQNNLDFQVINNDSNSAIRTEQYHYVKD